MRCGLSSPANAARCGGSPLPRALTDDRSCFGHAPRKGRTGPAARRARHLVARTGHAAGRALHAQRDAAGDQGHRQRTLCLGQRGDGRAARSRGERGGRPRRRAAAAGSGDAAAAWCGAGSARRPARCAERAPHRRAAGGVREFSVAATGAAPGRRSARAAAIWPALWRRHRKRPLQREARLAAALRPDRGPAATPTKRCADEAARRVAARQRRRALPAARISTT